ncbi:DUF47 family protein [Candidatus Pacearchaeota archaeon]|nr:DUF47 family protein [Candidatus Pacearchaeota archaeon]
MGAITDFLFPKEKIFFRMLNDAAENSMHGVEIFSEFVNNFSKLGKNKKKEYLNKMEEIEGRGDKIIHTINERLNKAFITPIDKEDIHQLSIILDDIIDLVYGATKQIVLYDLERIDKHVLELTKIMVEGVKEVAVLINSLSKTEFAKDNSVKIHWLENEADAIYRKAMVELYNGKRKPIELIKLKDVYFNLELVTDKIEDVSDVIQNVIIKHA